MDAPETVMRFASALAILEREITYRYGDIYDGDNQYLRIAYMLNEMDDAAFKKELQRRDKQRERHRDINNIYRMVADTGGDLLRQYVLEPQRIKEIMDIAIKLIEYANQVLVTIRKRYNCTLPTNIYLV